MKNSNDTSWDRTSDLPVLDYNVHIFTTKQRDCPYQICSQPSTLRLSIQVVPDYGCFTAETCSPDVSDISSLCCCTYVVIQVVIYIHKLCVKFPLFQDFPWCSGQTHCSLRQWFPTFLTRGALFRINFYGGAPQAYPMSYKLMVFRSSVTGGKRGQIVREFPFRM